ncbi:unnamed protein product [Leptidea sinapis]|uniref:Uncharacterized protein n=1 Tax=Leptidea sinapis TaxID=189913 RepID=A0A5E4R6J5_9NEOP|nr:unnamed protein product [Leptidea sinapis]
MVDLSGGQDGPLEHAFSNSVFILPGIVVVGLSARYFEPLSVETQLWVREHVDMAEEGLNINQIQQLLDEGKIPSKKALMDMLETADVEEELKENLRGMLMGDVPQVFGAYSTTLGVVFVFLICLVILFFGYKLYKSIKEKDLKREEKRKAKLMKKKK